VERRSAARELPPGRARLRQLHPVLHLPNVVDTERIKADFKDGMLKLVLPKKEEAKPKQISINVAK